MRLIVEPQCETYSMRPELAHNSFERLFVLANKRIKLLVLIEEVLVFCEDRGVGFFEFCIVCFCNGM